MEDAEILRERVLARLIKRRGQIEEWETYNDVLHCKLIISGKAIKNNEYELETGELPVFESLLPNENYVLITTKCFYSVFENVKMKVNYSEINNVEISSLEDIYYSRGKNKTTHIRFSLKDSRFVEFEVDSGAPADACYMLITYIFNELKQNEH